LRRQRDPESYRETLETCLTDARLLQRLVEALLTQVRSGSFLRHHPVETVSVGCVVSECMTAITPLAAARSIRLKAEGPQNLAMSTQTDRLRSVLLNLLGNAVEHNRENGDVTVTFGPDDNCITLDVRDTGPGIANEHLDRLFEPFYRVDSARTTGHLGLGLYLVQSHCRALGGTCHVESKVGEGTVFRVRLPGLVASGSAESAHPQRVPEL
jgi:signal transduction histidine kinase